MRDKWEYIKNKRALYLQQLRAAGLNSKYNCAGIYCIKLGEKIVYIGKADNMMLRIITHMIEIEKKKPISNKYKVLHDAKEQGIDISFDVLYKSSYKRIETIEKDIGEKEGVFIRKHNPLLNYQIPKEEDWHKYTVNKKAQTVTLAEVLAQ